MWNSTFYWMSHERGELFVKKVSKIRFIALFLTLLMVIITSTPMVSFAAQPTVNLGTTSSYAVLAGSGITNTGTTTINGDAGGDIGSAPTGTFTGQASVTTTGTVHLADAAATLAKADLVIAYDDAAGRTPVTRIATELGGTTLTPGVYDSADGTFQITGTLTLDAQGDPNGVFIFKTASTLITAANSNVNLINSARYCRTFWQVGSSATLGTNSNFVGHILALTSITANTGAAVQGQLLARNGAVTLDNNTIMNGLCADVAPTLATLHVIKHVINDNGRTSTAANFNLHVMTGGADVATSPTAGAEAPGTTYSLAAGTYAVTEDSVAGYTATYTGDSDGSGNITLAAGDDKTITITNDDQPLALATLHVIKHVVNDNGRTSTAANFNLHVKSGGVDVATSPVVGAEAPGTTYTLAAGTYAVTEDPVAGYTATYTGDSDGGGNITLAPGDDKTITITNDDHPLALATLHVIKHVVNDDGRTSTAANFNLHVKAGGIEVATSPKVGAEAPGTTYSLSAGTYTISEDPVSGYIAVITGDSDAGGNITLAAGADKTITITNNDIPVPPSVVSSASSGNSGNSTNSRNVTTGALQPPLINVTKIPSPLALTSGAGKVTYTYKVTNPVNVVLSNISVTDDKVSTVNYISGDTNKNKKLELGETWIYTSTATLTETTTNAVTAKGTGNGMTAFDVANATVIVTNSPSEVVYPPLINVTKIPNPLALISGKGTVVYTYKVTNPGVEPVSNVVIADDKVSLVNYVSGDTNDDKILQANETWTYNSKILLTKTETNTVTVKGEANGMTASDIAVATVIVTQPTVNQLNVIQTVRGGVLPITASPWYNLLLGGIALMLLGVAVWKYSRRYE